MDADLWDRSLSEIEDVDRLEQRLIRRVAGAVATAAVLVLLASTLGVARPGLSLTGSSGGSSETVTRMAEISLDVENRGVWPERLSSVEIDYPGLTITDAALTPHRLAPSNQGALVLSVVVDCSALTEDGQVAFDDEVASAASAPLTVRTQRPWGTATRTWDTDAVTSVVFLACSPPSEG